MIGSVTPSLTQRRGSLCHALSGLGSVIRHTQGVALGWYVPPLRGLAPGSRTPFHLMLYTDPNGVEHTSPGQRPGLRLFFRSSPERAWHNDGVPYVTPFQGWGLLSVIPRALPWAGMSRPFGA